MISPERMNAAETLASFAALALVRTAAALDSNWQKREKYYGSVGLGERQQFAERSGCEKIASNRSDEWADKEWNVVTHFVSSALLR